MLGTAVAKHDSMEFFTGPVLSRFRDRVPTILIAEPQWDSLTALDIIMRAEGYCILHAKTGIVARQLARSLRPDLVLMDVLLADGDGWETCLALKQLADTADIPVILLSIDNGMEGRMRGLEIGAADFMTMPFHAEELLARVRNHIRMRRQYRNVIDDQRGKLLQIRNAQRSMLVQPETHPDANFGIFFSSLDEAGGDFYDVIPLAGGAWGFIIADVSGHDLGASFATVALKMLVKQHLLSRDTPEEGMQQINTAMKAFLKNGQHVTLCFARLDRSKSLLSIVGAGHPPLIYMPRGGEPVTIEAEGDVLGAFSNVTFVPMEMKIDKGDRIFLYTDGLVEAFGENRIREEGIGHLSEACVKTSHLPIAEASPGIAALLFAAAGMPADDITLLGVEL